MAGEDELGFEATRCAAQQAQRAAVAVRDSFDDRQSEPAAADAATPEPLHCMCALFVGQARPLVSNQKMHCP